MCCSLELSVESRLLTIFLVSVMKMWHIVCASNRGGRDGGDSVEACVGGDIFYRCYKSHLSPREIDKEHTTVNVLTIWVFASKWLLLHCGGWNTFKHLDHLKSSFHALSILSSATSKDPRTFEKFQNFTLPRSLYAENRWTFLAAFSVTVCGIKTGCIK